MSRIILTAKWIRDSSIFSSIKPKNEKRLFVYFCFFHILTYLAPKNIKAKQVRTGKNKQLVTIFWLNLRKYCSVSYSLNCSWYFRYYLIHLKHSPTLSREDLFFCITEHVHSQKLNSLFGRTSFSFFRKKKSGIFTWWWPYGECQSWWPRSTCKWSLVQPSKNSKFSNQAHDVQHVPAKKKIVKFR